MVTLQQASAGRSLRRSRLARPESAAIRPLMVLLLSTFLTLTVLAGMASVLDTWG